MAISRSGWKWRNLALVAITVALSNMQVACRESKHESHTKETPNADRKIVLVTGALARSVTYSQLSKFANTGIAEGDIGNVINFGAIKSDQFREILNRRIPMDLVEASTFFNSEFGVQLLEKIGKAIHPRSGSKNAPQTLRAAIIQSLADDNTLSPLEVISNLPVDVMIELNEAMALAKEMGSFL